MVTLELNVTIRMSGSDARAILKFLGNRTQSDEEAAGLLPHEQTPLDAFTLRLREELGEQ